MKSVLQNARECYFCKTTYNLHSHHIFYGTANREISERFGMKVWLCQEHHTGPNGVHFDKRLDLALKCLGQEYFENHVGDREDFISAFGKSWLE